ncbi:hypothetical protein [Citrobacter sedlakii]|uniref:hypothetical protein n=1 Tax=Citrobacter sedlakii TaxID=67826 RepID=UPI00287ED319|nr:hypothetical protein [Salmonella enterica]EJY7095963.1 hypothetical protein [Salmonella enterica]HDX5344099.1 hypothetical protein [Citrobacter sedlakii]
MKKSWFHHTGLTETQADELLSRYRANNVRAEKSLAPDYLSWIVIAFLPESPRPPRQDRRYQQSTWRD